MQNRMQDKFEQPECCYNVVEGIVAHLLRDCAMAVHTLLFDLTCQSKDMMSQNLSNRVCRLFPRPLVRQMQTCRPRHVIDSSDLR